MPPYPWLETKELATDETRAKIETFVMVFDAYYPKAVIDDPVDALLEQAAKVANDTFPKAEGETPEETAEREAKIARMVTFKDGKPVSTKRITALIAYLQRMGTDISKSPNDDPSQVAKVADASGSQK